MKLGIIGVAMAAGMGVVAVGGTATTARGQFSCVFAGNGVVRYAYQQSISARCRFTLEELTPVTVEDRVKSVFISQTHTLSADVSLASYSGNAEACDGHSCDFSTRIPDYSHSPFLATRSTSVIRDPNWVQVYQDVYHTANADIGVSGNACLGSAAPSVAVGGTGGGYVMSTGYAVFSTSFRALSGSYQTQCYCFYSCDDPYSYYADNGVGSISATDSYTMYVDAGTNNLKVTVDADGGLSTSTQKNDHWGCTKITCIGTPAPYTVDCKQGLSILMYRLGAGATPSNPVKGALIGNAGSVNGTMSTSTSTWGGTGAFASVNSATPNNSTNRCESNGLKNKSWDVSASATPTHQEFTLTNSEAYILVITCGAKGGT